MIGSGWICSCEVKPDGMRQEAGSSMDGFNEVADFIAYGVCTARTLFLVVWYDSVLAWLHDIASRRIRANLEWVLIGNGWVFWLQQ